MSEYKRRKVHKKFHRQKIKPQKNEPRTEAESQDKIIMTAVGRYGENDTETRERPLRVIKSERRRKKHALLKSAVALLMVSGIMFLLSYVLPGGLADTAANILAGLGRGEYPIKLEDSMTIDVAAQGNGYYVLTSSAIYAYNANGKELFSHSHGFSSPVMTVSQSRALVFDQGGNTVSIYNLKGLKKTLTVKNKITTAAIGRNGSFAISVTGGEYTSTVYVYSKSGKNVYTWNSAKDIVNNAAVSPDGKKIALSLLNVSSGQFTTKLEVFGFNSADPLYTADFGEDIILSLRSNTKGVGAACSSGYSFFTWRKYERSNFIVKDKTLNMYRISGNTTVLAFNRESDKSDNTVIYLSASGKKISEFAYKGTVTDMETSGGRVYFISDTKLSIYNKKGELIKSGDCDYGSERFAVTGAESAALVSDGEIKEAAVK